MFHSVLKSGLGRGGLELIPSRFLSIYLLFSLGNSGEESLKLLVNQPRVFPGPPPLFEILHLTDVSTRHA